MARSIDADKLCEALKSMASVQYPDKQNTILGVVSSIENFPTADVVPKSEVERLSKELDELAEEYSDLIVEKDRTFDEAEVWYKKAKELEVELDAMRSAANSYKMHYNNLAREIFEEIEKIRLKEIKRCEVMREKEVTHAQRNYWEGGEHSLRQLSYWIAELKKKYTEEKE